ncbi:hypothetical protein BU16DRAFT_544586 [Lophium mytilinum]|uniref:Uncharacterized protein n=1 Tax=Lophium mytilinum TaxID=390894 RepID=A0A6A6QCI9_9PEZI|nr:hypothetical protein BU16DRAFT_544586 [Lophium mytilinum]
MFGSTPAKRKTSTSKPKTPAKQNLPLHSERLASSSPDFYNDPPIDDEISEDDRDWGTQRRHLSDDIQEALPRYEGDAYPIDPMIKIRLDEVRKIDRNAKYAPIQHHRNLAKIQLLARDYALWDKKMLAESWLNERRGFATPGREGKMTGFPPEVHARKSADGLVSGREGDARVKEEQDRGVASSRGQGSRESGGGRGDAVGTKLEDSDRSDEEL